MIHVEYRFQLMSYDVYVYREITPDTVSYLAISPEGIQNWSVPEERWLMHSEVVRPTYRIREDVARELVTQLTKLGVRPVDQSKIEGQYEAQSKHLADMRKLVFKEDTL